MINISTWTCWSCSSTTGESIYQHENGSTNNHLIYNVFVNSSFYNVLKMVINWQKHVRQHTLRIYTIYILYNFWVVLARFCPILVRVKSLKTPFGLVTSFIPIPITHGYNHTQLLLTPVRMYTAYNLTPMFPSWRLYPLKARVWLTVLPLRILANNSCTYSL
jgi:hypothetical protein